MKPINRRWLRQGLAALAWAVGLSLCSSASAQLLRELTLKDLVDQSDHIFVATCAERSTEFKNGNLVTRYRLKPSEFWKGGLAVDKDGAVDLEELGGAVEKPIPVGQYVSGMLDMKADEEVLLFARNPKEDPAKQFAPPDARPPSVSPDSIRVVGAGFGRYSIVRHPETGQKLLTFTRGGATNPKLAPKSGSQSQALAGKIDKNAESAKAARDRQAQKRPELSDQIYQFEALDSAKTRVRQLMNRKP